MDYISNSSLVALSFTSHHKISRSSTPTELPLASRNKQYTPYPLYKQKIGALLKPPDYSRNPPKFMSVREPRSEFEKKEASTQVKLLKKTFNTMYQRFNSASRDLTILKSESIKINALRTVGENDLENLKQHINSLEIEENQMLAKIRDEFNNNTMYKHIRERMRQTLMHLEVKNQYLSDQIRLRDFLIEGEHRKRTKTLENKFTKAQAYKSLRKTVELDKADRKADLGILQEDIEAREKIHELREVRMKKYEEIAETAANEERDAKNNNMREKLLVHVFWAKYLNKRLENEKKKSSHIEVAFNRIKSETLIGNVEDVVSRFLLKENRLIELMSALTQNKEKCLSYLRQNDQIENKIDQVLIMQKPGSDTNISNLKEKLYRGFMKCNQAKQTLLKLKTCKDKLRVWILKELEKFSLKPNMKNPSLSDLIIELQKCIKDLTKKYKSPFITEL